MSKAAAGAFTVSGPGIDRNGYQSGSVALSAAITLATGEATMYVRDGNGDAFGRVERDTDGSLTIIRLGEDRA